MPWVPVIIDTDKQCPILYGDASPLPSHCTTNCYANLHRWLLKQPMLMNTHAPLNGLKALQQMTTTPLAKPFSASPATSQLGTYYEQMVKHYLMACTDIIDVRSNIQVFNQQRTIGEFDFLWLDHRYECHHMECAIKFYLCDGPATELASFVGPNRHDSLARKWLHMTQKQIQLSTKAAGISACEQLGFPIPRHQHLLIQGYLFYPWHQTMIAPAALHPAINPQHNHGWWLHQHKRDQLTSNNSHQSLALQIRDKPDWLLNWNKPPQTENNAVEQRLAQATGPILVSRLAQDNEGNWQEVDRGFVVPDNWGASPEP